MRYYLSICLGALWIFVFGLFVSAPNQLLAGLLIAAAASFTLWCVTKDYPVQGPDHSARYRRRHLRMEKEKAKKKGKVLRWRRKSP